MRYKVVIFDLDGTLLDTLQDLTQSVNTLLNRYNFPTHDSATISSFVGHGAPYLLKESLPLERQEASSSYLEEFLSIYKDQNAHTTLYMGVDKVLDFLVSQNVRLSLFTNKPKSPTEAYLNSYLQPWTFFPAISQSPNSPTKPDPQGIYEILKTHHCTAKEAVYIGDSEVDIETAHNAGIPSISVSWGFRSYEQLKNAGAEHIITSPEQLLIFFQSAFDNRKPTRLY